MTPIIRFGIVGSVGFAIDGGVLTLMVTTLAVNPYIARLVSFSVAATITWALNRKWTFPGASLQRRGPQYVRYLVVQVIGALINLGIFAILIAFWPALLVVPVFPLAAGALVAMAFTLLSSKLFVFSASPTRVRNAAR